MLIRCLIALFLAGGAIAGCAHSHPSASTTGACYTESGWLDATNGCSIRAGYPDCYLVCPNKGTRVRVEKAE